MIRLSLPAGAPTWAVGVSIAVVLLTGLIVGLAWLARAALPATPAERLDWWKCYWQHRRDLRRDRWRRHVQRHAWRTAPAGDLSQPQSGKPGGKPSVTKGGGSNKSRNGRRPSIPAPDSPYGRLGGFGIEPLGGGGKPSGRPGQRSGVPNTGGEALASAVPEAPNGPGSEA